jgi:hypothetical protein
MNTPRLLGGRFRDTRGYAELTLDADGTFGYHGIWSGYEMTIVQGTWTQHGTDIVLKGSGSMASDTIGFDEREFDATFSLGEDGSLVGKTPLPGWSLLNMEGQQLFPARPNSRPLIDQVRIDLDEPEPPERGEPMREGTKLMDHLDEEPR